jgi:TorA maturation chaperone TorD
VRDQGLDRVVGVIEGVGAFAQEIGIAQPLLSNLNCMPAEHALAVESFPIVAPDAAVVDEIDAARGREYALLSVLLRCAPNADLLAQLAAIHADNSPLGLAHATLAEAAQTTNVERIEREFFNLFIGVGRGELVPYGSYYLTGFLNERPLARLRDDLTRLGIERIDGEAEPEDHAAALCEIMAGLASGNFGAPAGADRAAFEKHLAPWIGHFFADLEQAHAAEFYRRVGTVGRTFITIESEAFALG